MRHAGVVEPRACATPPPLATVAENLDEHQPLSAIDENSLAGRAAVHDVVGGTGELDAEGTGHTANSGHKMSQVKTRPPFSTRRQGQAYGSPCPLSEDFPAGNEECIIHGRAAKARGHEVHNRN